MKPLSPTDLLFLMLEKRQQPMHVGGLFLFRPPKDAGSDFVYNLVEEMRRSSIMPIFPFNQVLHNKVLWATDDDFDIDLHFRHISLPHPGRIRELLVYVSQEHSSLLDRSKPLWECHVIEGIEDNRFALYFKIHHALVDGIAAMNLIKTSLSTDPDQTSIEPLWAIPTKKKRRPPLSKIENKAKAISDITKQLKSIKSVAKEVCLGLLERSQSDFTTLSQAPMSILNQRVSSARRFAAQSYELARFQKIAKTFKVTINDVVLAVCSGALRQYLVEMNALPKKPLVAFVPISLRRDDSSSGNQITFILANLATNRSDPLDRLILIHRSMLNGKKRFSRMTKEEAINYSAFVYSLIGVNLLSGAVPKLQSFNIIISNVPGSKVPLYWNGARMDALYPVSIVLGGQAMNITLASYLDKIEFGITASARVLPKVQNMLQFLEDELTMLETLAYEAEQNTKTASTSTPPNQTSTSSSSLATTT